MTAANTLQPGLPLHCGAAQDRDHIHYCISNKKIDLLAILKFVHHTAVITHPLACDWGAVCCCRGAGTDVGVASAWRVWLVLDGPLDGDDVMLRKMPRIKLPSQMRGASRSMMIAVIPPSELATAPPRELELPTDLWKHKLMLLNHQCTIYTE